MSNPKPLYKNFRELFSKGFSIDWVNLPFITITHAVALAIAVWLIAVDTGWGWIALTWAIVHALIGSLSTTVYSHRLIAHGAAKKVSLGVHLFFCLFGQVVAVQASVRKWAANHVIHHGVDRHGKHHLDPYSATWFHDKTRNFLWSHVVTYFFDHPDSVEHERAFKAKNHPVIVWQDKFYLPLMIFWVFFVPMAAGYYFGGFTGLFALLGGSLMGMILAQHNTWTVNSITHMFGFTKGLRSSAVNNYIWMGPLGEGNHHGDHHDFPTDYRNGFGISGWLLDPTRYVILALNSLGLVKDLRRATKKQEAEIIAKRKLARVMGQDRSALIEQLERKVENLKGEWLDAVQRFETLKAESKLIEKASQRRQEIAEEIAHAKRQMKLKREAFMLSVKSLRYQIPVYG